MSQPRLQAFVISLPAREDRRRAFSKAWDASACGSAADARFIPGIAIPDHITGYARMALCDMACAVSHRRAVATAAAAGLESVLVLEDDAEPEEGADLAGFLARLANAPAGWDTVNLGGCTAQWRPATPALQVERVGKDWSYVRGMVTTHAILYHRMIYDDVLASVPDDEEFANTANGFNSCRPYDQWLGSHGRMLTGNHPLFVQSGSCSDILGVPHGTSIAKLIRDTYQTIRETL